MANDGQIVFEVTADGKHAIADIKEITRAIQQETGKWDTAAKASTDSISSNFSGMLKKLAAGFSAVKIGKALLDFGKDALEAASNLEEVQNVVDVTFGEGAGQIEKWAKSASAQFGLTETQAKKFSSTMGAMLKSSGLAGDKIVDVSTDLAGLAADMASFYNLDFEEAFGKIRSGMSGMAMPLKELGIDMSETALKAFAMQQGLEKSFDEMDTGEKTMLRYQYLMQATADAQGDFARTSDGYANSMRKLETNVEGIKTKLGQTFLDTVANAAGKLNEFLGLLMPDESKRTVLDDFADIDLKTEAKLEQIRTIREEADSLTGVLDDLFGKQNPETGELEGGKDTAETLSKLGVVSDEAKAYLEGLGLSTDDIAEKQGVWLETCKRLVKTIPGLSSIINTETGEVKGGTQAVYDYIEAWEKGQTKLAMLGALEQKESAIASRFNDLPGLELDMAVAERRVKKSFEQLKGLYKKYGVNLGFDKEGKIVRDFSVYGLQAEDIQLLNKETDYYEQLVKNAQDARDAYQLQADALDEAKAALEEYRATIDEMPSGVENAVLESEKFWTDNAETISTMVDVAKGALANLDDYVQGVRDSVAKSIDSTVGGFNKIETPMMKAASKTKDLTGKLDKLGSRTKANADEWDKLNEELNQYESTRVSSQGINENLKQQAEYMQTYLDNLRKARELGISNDVLAALSDGTEESYDTLAALAEASPGEVEQINASYQAVIDKKKELTDELTNQQLTVDQTYQSLYEKAKEAVDALNLEETAGENAGKTVHGAAEGIKKHLPELTDAVDAIIAQMDRLAGVGIDLDITGGGIQIKPSSSRNDNSGGNVVQSFASGIDYVPHDMLARIHEGEKVLTAQEAAVYRGLANGGLAGVDLDALGGVMRDNVQPGGNVYLDGRIVGNVISDRQGRSYKSLQRSGWQA